MFKKEISSNDWQTKLYRNHLPTNFNWFLSLSDQYLIHISSVHGRDCFTVVSVLREGTQSWRFQISVQSVDVGLTMEKQKLFCIFLRRSVNRALVISVHEKYNLSMFDAVVNADTGKIFLDSMLLY